jgi:hypothetical protein
VGTRCNSADQYRGIRKPICQGKHACDACIDIYIRATAEKIMHNDMHDDPFLVRRLAANIVEVLGRRE